MDWRQRLCALCLPVLAVLLAAGCGSASTTPGSSPRSNTTSKAEQSSLTGGAPSQAQFIARAETICRRVNVELRATSAKSASLPKLAQVAAPHAALERAAIRELSKLAAPAAIAAQWRKMIAFRRRLAAEITVAGRDAKAGDAAALKALAAVKLSLHKKLFSIATRAGFKDCALVG